MLKVLDHLPRSQRGIEEFPFTKYLVKTATILRDHLQTNASDEAIVKDMVDVVVFMQGLVAVGDTNKFFFYDTSSITLTLGMQFMFIKFC
jgi:hypothetical protein